MTDHIRPEMTLPYNRTALWYSSVTKITPVFVNSFSFTNIGLSVRDCVRTGVMDVWISEHPVWSMLILRF